jgi:hypothetical protein
MDNIKRGSQNTYDVAKRTILNALEDTIYEQVNLIKDDIDVVAQKTTTLESKVDNVSAIVKNAQEGFNDKLSRAIEVSNTLKDALRAKDKTIEAIKADVEALKLDETTEDEKEIEITKIKGLGEVLNAMQAQPISQPITQTVLNNGVLVKGSVSKVNYIGGLAVLNGDTVDVSLSAMPSYVANGVLTGSDYVPTWTPSVPTLVSGLEFTFIPDLNCPVDPTFAGVLIKEAEGTTLNNLEANDLIGGGFYRLRYNGTNYVLQANDVESNLPDWQANKSYNALDTVKLGNRTLRRIADGTSNGTFDNIEAATWILVNNDAVTSFTGNNYYYPGEKIYQNGMVWYRQTAGVSTAQFDNLESPSWFPLTNGTLQIPNWAATTFYQAGQVVRSGTRLLTRNLTGTSLATINSDLITGAWDLISNSGVQTWTFGVYYFAGEHVIQPSTGELMVRTSSGTSNVSFLAPEGGAFNYLSQNKINNFVAGIYYHIGALIYTNGTLYQRLSAGVSGGTFAADAINWSPFTSSGANISPWGGLNYYEAGAFVTQGTRILYRLTAGTALASFTNVEAATWGFISNESASLWTANTYYYASEQVSFNGRILGKKVSGVSGLTAFDAVEAALWNELVPPSPTGWSANTLYYQNDLAYAPTTGTLIRKLGGDTVTNGSFNAIEGVGWTSVEASNNFTFFAPSVYYYIGDVVQENGLMYICRANHFSGATFNTVEQGNWYQLASISTPVSQTSKNLTSNAGTTIAYTMLATDGTITSTPGTVASSNINITLDGTLPDNKEFTIVYVVNATTPANQTILTASGGTTIINPTTFLPVASFVAPGTAGQHGTIIVKKVNNVWEIC